MMNIDLWPILLFSETYRDFTMSHCAMLNTRLTKSERIEHVKH